MPRPPPRPPHRPPTARERVREEMTAEILSVAGDHLARDGAAALSLRSIARELGMAPSALYRYFDGRDALLSALILAPTRRWPPKPSRPPGGPTGRQSGRDDGSGDAERWPFVPRAGTPVGARAATPVGPDLRDSRPGLRSPEGHRRALRPGGAAMVRPLVEAHEGGRLRSDPPARPVTEDMARPWRRSAKDSSPACRPRSRAVPRVLDDHRRQPSASKCSAIGGTPSWTPACSSIDDRQLAEPIGLH